MICKSYLKKVDENKFQISKKVTQDDDLIWSIFRIKYDFNFSG